MNKLSLNDDHFHTYSGTASWTMAKTADVATITVTVSSQRGGEVRLTVEVR